MRTSARCMLKLRSGLMLVRRRKQLSASEGDSRMPCTVEYATTPLLDRAPSSYSKSTSLWHLQWSPTRRANTLATVISPFASPRWTCNGKSTHLLMRIRSTISPTKHFAAVGPSRRRSRSPPGAPRTNHASTSERVASRCRRHCRGSQNVLFHGRLAGFRRACRPPRREFRLSSTKGRPLGRGGLHKALQDAIDLRQHQRIIATRCHD